MIHRRPRPARVLGLAAFALVAAACSSSSSTTTSTADSTPTVETVPTTTIAVASTIAEPTTTAEAPTTVTEAPTTTAAPAPTWPLTGLPQTDPLLALRPAIAVKLDNHKEARPHAGLIQADIVFEEIVEAQITRFFAVFHSTDAAPVGPVRSARTTDVDLLNQLNRPLFAWSGGNRGVVQAIGAANAESRAAGQRPDLYYRDQERHKRTAIEHTLFLKGTQDLWATISPGQGTPSPLFQYRPAGTPSVGDPSAGFDLNLRSVPVHWTWDAAQGLWLRDEYGAPHTDISGAQISTNNVVVEFIQYGTSPVDARSPQGYSVGSGDAMVFSDGKVQLVHWDRPSADAPATFTTADGSPVLLTPGRTWVELAEAGSSRITPA